MRFVQFAFMNRELVWHDTACKVQFGKLRFPQFITALFCLFAIYENTLHNCWVS